MKDYYKTFFNSNILFSKSPVELVFIEPEILPNIELSSTLKYSPRLSSISLLHKKSFFLKLFSTFFYLKQFCSPGELPKLKNLHFFFFKSNKKQILKFRKRKNLFLNLQVNSSVSPSFVFELLPFLLLFKEYSFLLHSLKKTKKSELLINVEASRLLITIYFIGLPEILSFFLDASILSVDKQLFELTLDFSSSPTYFFYITSKLKNFF